MKTGGILFFGGVVLLVLGGLGGLVFIGPLLRGQGGTFSNLLAVLVLGALRAAGGGSSSARTRIAGSPSSPPSSPARTAGGWDSTRFRARAVCRVARRRRRCAS